MYIDPRKKRVLVVDDDEFIRDLLSSWLELRGYQVASAKNGHEALEQRQQTRFDLILLDIMMPGLNGYDVLKQLRAEQDLTPVIVMSALNDVNNVVNCIKLGAEDYLNKPIESELLWARITASLQKKHYQDLQQGLLDDSNLLQQIDQELNTTLNRKEVSQLALRWVMQKTGAVGSLIGSVDGHLLTLQAAEGLDEREHQSLSLPRLGIDKYQTEVTQGLLPTYGRLHPEAKYRITIPINRNAIIRDIIILETTAPAADSTLRFLKQLSTHIAIALHNAQLYADAQAANEAKSNFVAMVSHELKNPLVAIQSYTHLMQRQLGKMSTQKQNEYLDIIFRGSERIHNLALELDDITQIEIGQFKLTIEAVDFSQILDEAIQLLEPQINKKRQTIRLDIPAKLPPVQADAKRLNQILANLISNACKYTLEAGHIAISAKITDNEATPQLSVTVTDNGIGISPESQAKIFQQFYRADDLYVNKVRGTGLGLNITKKLVELQGGEIGFTSNQGKGSTFYFTIPVIKQETAVKANVNAAPVA